MKGPKIWWLIGAIGLVISGSVAYAVLSGDSGPAYRQPGSADSAAPSGTNNGTDNQAAQKGSYIEYSPAGLSTAQGQRWLFFHAGWCPQCRAIEEDIKRDGVPAGVTILKVDYDSSSDLKQKYGVTLQTTFVAVDDRGDQIKKFVAYNDPTLDAVVNALME